MSDLGLSHDSQQLMTPHPSEITSDLDSARRAESMMFDDHPTPV